MRRRVPVEVSVGVNSYKQLLKLKLFNKDACFVIFLTYCYFIKKTCNIINVKICNITLKRLGGRVGVVNLTPSCGHLHNVSSKERLNPVSFVNFNIIKSYVFPENLSELPQVVQKL